MVIHFETLWEQAEAVPDCITAETATLTVQKHIDLLATDSENMREFHMGEILYGLTKLSQILKINTYTALQKTMTDKKSELLDKK